MTRRERVHLMSVLGEAGIKLTLQSAGFYAAVCPGCGGPLEVHLDAPIPELALLCGGRPVTIHCVEKEGKYVH